MVKRYNIFTVLLLCITLFMGVLGCYEVNKISTKKEIKILELQCENLADELNSTLEIAENLALIFSADFSKDIQNISEVKDTVVRERLIQMNKESATDILRNLIEGNIYLRFDPSITNDYQSGYYIGNMDGTIEDLEKAVLDETSNVDNTSWYYIPKNAETGTWIDPYLEGNHYVITYSIPLYVDDMFVGVFGIQINNETLKNSLNLDDTYKNYKIQLVDKSGIVVFENGSLDASKGIQTSIKTTNNMTLTVYGSYDEVLNVQSSPVFRGVLVLLCVLFAIAIIMLLWPLFNRVNDEEEAVKGLKKILVYMLVASLLIEGAMIKHRYDQLIEESRISFTSNNTYDTTLRVVGDIDFEPYSFMKDNELQGFDIDLIYAVANKLEMNVDIQLIPWTDCEQMAIDGQADIILGVDVIEAKDSPYLKSHDFVEDSFVIYGKEPISSILDLKDKRLATIYGTSQLDIYGLEGNAVVYDTYAEEMAALENGYFDYVVVRKNIGEMLIHHNGYIDIFQVYETMESRLGYGIMDETLLNRVNEVIDELKADGTIDALQKKWIQRYAYGIHITDLIYENRSLIIIFSVFESLIVIGYVAIVLNARRQMHDKIRRASQIDALSGIYNRGAGEAKIRQLMNRKVPGMFIVIDVDDFKRINDTYGHAVGDKVITEIANSMLQTFRDLDVSMRLGGDEFVAFTASVTDITVGSHIIERLLNNIGRIQIKEMNNETICVSVGATLYKPANKETFDEVYKRADSKLYESKKIKGNSYTFFEGK